MVFSFLENADIQMKFDIAKLDRELEEEEREKLRKNEAEKSTGKLDSIMIARKKQQLAQKGGGGPTTKKSAEDSDSDNEDERIGKNNKNKSKKRRLYSTETFRTPPTPESKLSDRKASAKSKRNKKKPEELEVVPDNHLASPASSVSMSQPQSSTRKKTASKGGRKQRSGGSSSSEEDSDSDDDSVQKPRSSTQDTKPQAAVRFVAAPRPWLLRKQEESSDSSSSSESEAEEEDQATSSPTMKQPATVAATKKTNKPDVSDSSSDEEEDVPSREEAVVQPQRRSFPKRQPAQRSDNKALEDPSDDEDWQQSREVTPTTKKESKSNARRDHADEENFANTQQINERKNYEAQRNVAATLDDDVLWLDDQGEERIAAPAVMGEEERRAAQDETAEEVFEEVMERVRERGGKRASKYASDSDDEEEEDEAEMAKALHPEFLNPLFGPFEFAPLVLSEEHNHQVPAALTRYLLDYQREGIQFLYDSIDNGQGCGAILADDMGLGKTVQVISTIAAFLGKTGTGLDKIKIRKRKALASEFKLCLENRNKNSLARSCGIVTKEVEEKVLCKFREREQGLSPVVAPVLLVVPVVVVDNWDFEFSLWGHFRAAVFREHGQRTTALNDIKYGSAEVLICPHSLFQSSSTFKDLQSIHWKLVVVDEFHHFKNFKSDVSKNLRKIKETWQCPVLGLTGTPMQNNLDELFNLIDIISPGYLGESRKAFEKYTAKPIRLGRSVGATADSVAHADKCQKELWAKLRPMYIQRFKTDVLKDMPEKFEKVVFCELSDLQKQIYAELLNKPDYTYLRGANAPCDCGINRNFFWEYKNLRTSEEKIDYQRKNEFVKRRECCYVKPVEFPKGPVAKDAVLWHSQHPDGGICTEFPFCPGCIFLPALTKLYQLSSHVSLLQVGKDDKKSSDKEKLLKLEKFAKLSLKSVLHKLPTRSIYRDNGWTDDPFSLSGKLKEVDKLLAKIALIKGRTLIFSYSTQTLDMIESYLKSKALYQYLRIDGSTPAKARTRYVDTFQTDESYTVMLLSTRAAGVGLNLTGAANVIIFDCEWNPALDAQAQDRSFRIGQKKDVTVYRLVAQGTIDELKYLRQIYKLQLKEETFRSSEDPSAKALPKSFKGVEKDQTRKGELFGMENLLSFKPDGSFMDEVWKEEKEGSVASNKVKAHDATALVKALHNGNTDALDRQDKWIHEAAETACSRVKDHGWHLKGASYRDDPDKHMFGEERQNDEFVNQNGETAAGDKEEIMENEKVAKSPVAKRTHSRDADTSGSEDEDEVDDTSPEPKKQTTAGRKKPRVSITPRKSNNYSICGVSALDFRTTKTTFSKADFFIPPKKKKSSN